MSDDRIIIFGLGQKFRYNKKKYASFFETLNIVAYLDNNRDMWGNELEGIPVLPPESVRELSYDRIVLMTVYVKDMRQQLLNLGVSSDKIMLWEQFLCEDKHGICTGYGTDHYEHPANCRDQEKRRLLLISVRLDYNGGTIAVLDAAMALIQQGYDVTVAAPDGNPKLIQEAANHIHIAIVPAINFPKEQEKIWIGQYDLVLVNVFQMIRCACEISQIKPVIWWIHECSEKFDSVYPLIRDNFSEYDNLEAMSDVNVMAVSRIAGGNFNYYYRSKIQKIMPYGMRDFYEGGNQKSSKKYIFAVIGSVMERKAQSDFLQAIRLLSPKEKEHVEFWIIGYLGDDPYSREIETGAREMTGVRVSGELTREEIKETYREIDVVVCCSLEETMSMTITEGMMNEKVCITTDATGMADYIQDKVNGLICHAGDAQSLHEAIRWVLRHPGQCDEIRRQGRKTYEQYFTLEKLGERLGQEVERTLRRE